MVFETTRSRSQYMFTDSSEQIRDVLQNGHHVDYTLEVSECGIPYIGKVSHVTQSFYTLGCQRCQAIILWAGDQRVLLHVAPAVCGTWYLQFCEYLRDMCNGLCIQKGTVIGSDGRVQQLVTEILSDVLDIPVVVAPIKIDATSIIDVYVHTGETVIVHKHYDINALQNLKITERTRMLKQ